MYDPKGDLLIDWERRQCAIKHLLKGCESKSESHTNSTKHYDFCEIF